MPYDLWVSRGLIRQTSGEAADFARIEHDIVALSKQYRILEIGYDDWSATQMAQNLDGQALNMIALRQGFADAFAGDVEVLGADFNPDESTAHFDRRSAR